MARLGFGYPRSQRQDLGHDGVINKQTETGFQLGGDDAAQGMTARQNDAAVVDFGRRHAGNLRFGQGGALRQGSATGRAPVCFLVDGEDSVAMGADPLHEARLLETDAVSIIRKVWPGSAGSGGGLDLARYPYRPLVDFCPVSTSAAGIFSKGCPGRRLARLKGKGKVFGFHRPPKTCTSAGQNQS